MHPQADGCFFESWTQNPTRDLCEVMAARRQPRGLVSGVIEWRVSGDNYLVKICPLVGTPPCATFSVYVDTTSPILVLLFLG
jgi:hypothetical protein